LSFARVKNLPGNGPWNEFDSISKKVSAGAQKASTGRFSANDPSVAARRERNCNALIFLNILIVNRSRVMTWALSRIRICNLGSLARLSDKEPRVKAGHVRLPDEGSGASVGVGRAALGDGTTLAEPTPATQF
jgi:hypothetical protein